MAFLSGIRVVFVCSAGMGNGVVADKLHVARFEPHIEMVRRVQREFVVEAQDFLFLSGEGDALVALNRAKVITLVKSTQSAVGKLCRCYQTLGLLVLFSFASQIHPEGFEQA